MILKPAGYGGVVNPLTFGSGERRKMPPWMIGAIGASIAIHIAGGVWLYNQRFVLPVEEPAEGPIIEIDVYRPKPPPPVIKEKPVAAKPPAAVPVRPTLNVPPTAPVSPVPANPTAPPGDNTATTLIPQAPTVDPGPVTAPVPSVIRNPTWLKKPNASQMERAYPVRAAAEGLAGRAELRCVVTAAGTLSDCSVVSESPAGQGFGQAALKLSRYFRLNPRTVDGQAEGSIVNIPVRFSME